MYLVFDIETVPDVRALARWLRMEESAPAPDILAAWREARPDAVMPKPPFQQVVAVAAAVIDDEGRLTRLRAMGEPGDGEASILERFFRVIERGHPRLVGWNSSGFDLPVMLYRALAHRLALAPFYRQKNYRYRYNEEWHLDLMDLLSGYGATTRVALDELAAVLGFPGKLGLDGGDVWNLYREGRIDTIRAYCETDVLTTLLIFNRYALQRGWLDQAQSATLDRDVAEFLSGQDEPHWAEFRTVWQERSGTEPS